MWLGRGRAQLFFECCGPGGRGISGEQEIDPDVPPSGGVGRPPGWSQLEVEVDTDRHGSLASASHLEVEGWLDESDLVLDNRPGADRPQPVDQFQ